MIAKTQQTDVWARLREPMEARDIQWRIDGKSTERDGRHFARVVAYCDVPAVFRRLDAVVPGEWDYTAEVIPGTGTDNNGQPVVAVKGRLQVLGVIREDVGQGADYKTANTDAFKRTARLFGIALELWEMDGPLFVQVSAGKFPKIEEDCNAAYERKFGRNPGFRAEVAAANGGDVDDGKPDTPPARASRPARQAPAPAPAVSENGDSPACPKCGGAMWDNRLTKRNPKAPDFKCRQKGGDPACDGVIWPPRPAPAPADMDPDEIPF